MFLTNDRSLNLNTHFATQLLSEFPHTNRKIITIPSSSTIREAVITLHEARLFSVPVVTEESSELIGTVDLMQVVQFINRNLTEDHKAKNMLTFLGVIDEEGIGNALIKSVLPPVKFGPFTPLTTKNTLLDAMIVMGKYNVKRIPVVPPEDVTTGALDKSPHLVNFLTQSALLAQVQSVCKQKGLDLNIPISSAGLPISTNVICVNLGDQISHAFELMTSKIVTGVGVKDENGVLVANISPSDVFYLIASHTLFAKLCRAALTVAEFLASRKEDSQSSPLSALVTCSPSSTLREVIDELDQKNVHHIYVLDPANNNTLVGVIAVCDVLSALIVETPDHWHTRIV